ncbi:MAG: phage head closure protein [Litoreibacter sp.]|uniref:phage head closure protein n=1 Tax=Litoreibacter sp. TaxID=1969459 RepID=UPI0032976502
MAVVLNRRLTLEHAVRVADGAGGYTEAWMPLGELWAQMKAGTGRERFGAGVTVSAVAYKIVVRGAAEGSYARPQPDQRFREGARVYRILGVAEYDLDGRYLTCFATEEVTG